MKVEMFTCDSLTCLYKIQSFEKRYYTAKKPIRKDRHIWFLFK